MMSLLDNNFRLRRIRLVPRSLTIDSGDKSAFWVPGECGIRQKQTCGRGVYSSGGKAFAAHIFALMLKQAT
jgi:hypothetical protein